MKIDFKNIFDRLVTTYLVYKKSTIERKIFFYFLFFSTSFILISALLVGFLFFKTYIKTEEDHAKNSSNKAKQNIEFIINMVINTGSHLATSPELLKNLSEKEKKIELSSIEETSRMNSLLVNVISLQEMIKDIYVVGRNGKFYTSYWNENKNEVVERFGKMLDNRLTRSEYLRGGPYVSFFPFFDLNIISYIRPIYYYQSDKSLGTIIIDLNYTYLREIFTFSSLQQDSERVIIVNSKGKVLFSFPFNISFEHIIKEYPILISENNTHINAKVFGEDSIILSNSIASSDWKIVRILNKSNIYANINKMATMGIAVWILFMVIALIVSFLISSSITKPIIELHKVVKVVENGDLSVRARIYDNDEIGQLAESFNAMIDQISNLLKKTLEEQKRKSDLEFQILQSQINPHFLYNTLDSMKWLAIFQGVENIGEMATALINLLKYNISKKTTLVNLEEEVASIKDYIEIQKFRFGDAFHVEYLISEDTKYCQVLKFILQPLVENSIFHGFSNMDKEGIIKIRSTRLDKQLLIEVSDNGKGIDYEQMINVDKNKYDKRKINNGIGVSNVIERIKLYFGDQGSFIVHNNKSGGLLIEIKIPLIE